MDFTPAGERSEELGSFTLVTNIIINYYCIPGPLRDLSGQAPGPVVLMSTWWRLMERNSQVTMKMTMNYCDVRAPTYSKLVF